MRKKKSKKQRQGIQLTPVKIWNKEKSISYRYAKQIGILPNIIKQMGWRENDTIKK